MPCRGLALTQGRTDGCCLLHLRGVTQSAQLRSCSTKLKPHRGAMIASADARRMAMCARTDCNSCTKLKGFRRTRRGLRCLRRRGSKVTHWTAPSPHCERGVCDHRIAFSVRGQPETAGLLPARSLLLSGRSDANKDSCPDVVPFCLVYGAVPVMHYIPRLAQAPTLRRIE